MIPAQSVNFSAVRPLAHRTHRTIKSDAIRPGQFETLGQVKELIANYVAHHNERRLHSAIGYITPTDKLAGKAEAIFEAREQKLAAAREKRRQNRESVHLDQLLQTATA